VVVDVHRRRIDTVSWDLLPETAQAVQTGEVETSRLPLEDRTRVYILLLHEITAIVGETEPTIHQQIKRTRQILQEFYHDGE